MLHQTPPTLASRRLCSTTPRATGFGREPPPAKKKQPSDKRPQKPAQKPSSPDGSDNSAAEATGAAGSRRGPAPSTPRPMSWTPPARVDMQDYLLQALQASSRQMLNYTGSAVRPAAAKQAVAAEATAVATPPAQPATADTSASTDTSSASSLLGAMQALGALDAQAVASSTGPAAVDAQGGTAASNSGTLLDQDAALRQQLDELLLDVPSFLATNIRTAAQEAVASSDDDNSGPTGSGQRPSDELVDRLVGDLGRWGQQMGASAAAAAAARAAGSSGVAAKPTRSTAEARKARLSGGSSGAQRAEGQLLDVVEPVVLAPGSSQPSRDSSGGASSSGSSWVEQWQQDLPRGAARVQRGAGGRAPVQDAVFAPLTTTDGEAVGQRARTATVVAEDVVVQGGWGADEDPLAGVTSRLVLDALAGFAEEEPAPVRAAVERKHRAPQVKTAQKDPVQWPAQPQPRVAAAAADAVQPAAQVEQPAVTAVQKPALAAVQQPDPATEQQVQASAVPAPAAPLPSQPVSSTVPSDPPQGLVTPVQPAVEVGGVVERAAPPAPQPATATETRAPAQQQDLQLLAKIDVLRDQNAELRREVQTLGHALATSQASLQQVTLERSQLQHEVTLVLSEKRDVIAEMSEQGRRAAAQAQQLQAESQQLRLQLDDLQLQLAAATSQAAGASQQQGSSLAAAGAAGAPDALAAERLAASEQQLLAAAAAKLAAATVANRLLSRIFSAPAEEVSSQAKLGLSADVTELLHLLLKQ